MGVNDYGGPTDTTASVPFGGIGGWAESVAQVLNNSDTTVDARLATLADDIAAMGVWQPYTPAVSGALTLGNGTAYGRYSIINKTCHLQIALTLGTTSVMGSGTSVVVSPPPGATPRNSSVMRVRASARFGRSGVNAYWGVSEVSNGAISTSPQVVSGTTVANGTFPDNPFPWSANDTITFDLTYEIEA